MRKRRDLIKWTADQLQAPYAEYGKALANRGVAAGTVGGLDDLSLAASLEGGD